jgi:2'-hydroxyisoflavone reductase
MVVTRRTFLQTAAAAAATAALGPALGAAGTTQSGKGRPAPLRILILGGTGFLGPATIEAALARGHHVTMFNRGRTRPDLFPTVERLQGDRDPKKGDGLKALETGTWDVVIDNSAYYPRLVAASAGLLAGRVKR